MTNQPDAARKGLINTAIVGLKADGVWPLLDSLQVYAAADQQAATVDWRLPSRLAVPVNSPTFTADRGFTGDAVTNYVNTNYSTVGSLNWTGTNSFFGSRVNGAPALEDNALGVGRAVGNSRSAINPQNSLGVANVVSATTTSDSSTSNANLRSFFMNRADVSAFDYYYAVAGSAVVNNKVRTGNGNPSDVFFVGARNGGSGTPTGPSARPYSLFVAGGALTGAQVQNFVTRIENYMTGVGNTA